MADSSCPRWWHSRRRVLKASSAFVGGLVILTAMAACHNRDLPNTTFNPHTEFGRQIDDLWNLLLHLGTAVFISVEALLVITIVRYRQRPGQKEPEHVHGNTTLEILWTVIPAAVLVFIAVPTVRTIFRTQADAPAGALQVEVYGHQWWWEFRYPQYHITTANELYLPIGRTVNFTLRSKDVIHSFWIPQLGGKRDVVTNHTNYLWYTPDSDMAENVWNGQCAEYCGDSHGDMKIRAYTVSEANFESWAAHQSKDAVFPAAADTMHAAPGKGTAAAHDTTHHVLAVVTDSGYVFPLDKMPNYAIPQTPTPEGLSFSAGLTADAARGEQTFSHAACIGCHTISGNKMAMGITGPNLTHVASRHTIAAGLYPNDTAHLRLWIKNARMMKPGVIMPTLGLGQTDPITGQPVTAAVGGLTDQQIADIVAYLQELK